MPYGVPGIPLISPDAGPVPPVPLQQPQNLFRFGEQTIWSTQYHAGATALAQTTSRLFTTPIGQVGQGFGLQMTIAETNLKEGGRVPSGVAYDVFGVATSVVGASAAADVAGTTLDRAFDTNVLIRELTNQQQNGIRYLPLDQC